MKVLIVSDTHGQDDNLKFVLSQIGSIDALIHCGDVEGDEDYIAAMAECPTYIVAGNNDYFSSLPRELEFELQGYRVLLTHGHNYGVSMGTQVIVDEGRSRGVDIVMFGHTHRPSIEQYQDITVLNPGSLSYPRQPGRRPSFMVIELNQKGEISYKTSFIGE